MALNTRFSLATLLLAVLLAALFLYLNMHPQSCMLPTKGILMLDGTLIGGESPGFVWGWPFVYEQRYASTRTTGLWSWWALIGNLFTSFVVMAVATRVCERLVRGKVAGG